MGLSIASDLGGGGGQVKIVFELGADFTHLGNVNAYLHLLPRYSILERSGAEMWVRNKPNKSNLIRSDHFIPFTEKKGSVRPREKLTMSKSRLIERNRKSFYD